ncbi:MAG TPA: fatty acid desaturase [Solirubrobacteraceae bacterium]|nr:fatty acid desaturase [Solirubrobacteraceae bacterium]
MTLPAAPTGGTQPATPSKKAWWVEALEPYARPDLRRGVGCLLTSVVPYVALWPAMYYLLRVSYALTLLVALLASGFLVRTFIVFHDCGHGSFLPNKRANRWVGALTGLLVYNPYFAWTHEHAGHHASSGDLDRRGVGDVDTWTVSEYQSNGFLGRLGYRLLRSPFVMYTVGPLWALALEPRKLPFGARRRVLRSHALTNLAVLAMVGMLVWLLGWQAFLEIQLPLVLFAGAAGIWLFYVQHQFEDAYWTRSGEWSYAEAALKGSSYLKLPKVLQFFSGNIGLHHVHHLQPRIPNYSLQRAHDENPFLHAAPTISFWEGIRTINLKLIDEPSGRLVSFAEARRSARAATPSS